MKNLLKIEAIIFLCILGVSLTRIIPTVAQRSEVVRKARSLHDVHQTTRSARDLSASDVQDLEKQLAKDPNDTTLRTKLIGYYGDYRHWRDVARRGKYHEHVIWLITNNPTAPVLGTPYAQLNVHRDGEAYFTAKKAWLEQFENNPKSIEILRNASGFFTLADRDIAFKLTRQAETLEPTNPDWPKKLGHLYELEMRGYKTIDSEMAAKSVEAYQRAHKLTKGTRREASVLQSLAKTAFAAEQFELAQSYASTLVNEEAGEKAAPNSIHHGNTVLGRLAVKRGDMTAAKEHLLASARIDGSPTLSSFGPSMALAHDLLKMSEWEAVSQYFDLCAKFWNRPKDLKQLDEWKVLVKAERIPDFGPNVTR